MAEMEMKGKVALVTGASSGIGRASALRFAADGAAVALVARRRERLEELALEIEESGGATHVEALDLAEEGAPERAVAATVEALGGLDVVINAAGIYAGGSLEATTLEQWERQMAVNLRAPFLVMQAAMPHLVERRGAVVNVSSVTGLRAFPGVVAYCVSKAGLDQLTRCAALEWAAHGVRVNAVNPGVVVTELHRAGGMSEEAYEAFKERSAATHPLGRVGRAEEVAELVHFLASERSGWITGDTVSIDGGRAQTCAR